MATIRIVDLKVRGIIGTHPWERLNQQEVVVNVILDYDASKAATSDNLKDALDYERIGNQIIKTVEGTKYHLLEKLAAKLLKDILADKRVICATVKIDKPHAMAQAKHIAYELSGKN